MPYTITSGIHSSYNYGSELLQKYIVASDLSSISSIIANSYNDYYRLKSIELVSEEVVVVK
jgi:hypothetical protein